MMIDDTSLEFDMFEDARQRLVMVLVGDGHARIEAEKIALYVIQGLRDMPRFLTMLSDVASYSPAEVIETLHRVLGNANALARAKELMLEFNDADHA